jgi:regulator of protease activity HflC (stomatin/prohibitin superfamily)
MKAFKLIVVLLMVLVVAACGRVVPGEEGFLVNNWGSDKGNIETLATGLHWYNPMKYDLRTYPLQLQNIAWEVAADDAGAFSWNDKDGMVFQADIGIAYRVQPGASAAIFSKYRKGLDEVTTVDMRNRLQDAFNTAGSKRTAA